MKKFVILASMACLLFTGVSTLSAQAEKKEATKTEAEKKAADKKAADKKAAEKPAPKN